MNWAAINDLSLNALDWLIIAVLTVSTLLSLWRGFVREALSLGAWVLAFVMAGMFAEVLASYLSAVISNVTGRYIAAYVVIFVSVLVFGTLINAIMKRLIRVTGLSTLDRLLGMVFGFTRGVIIVLVLVFIAQELLQIQDQQMLAESELMPHLEMIAYWLRSAFMELNAGLNKGISV